MLCDWIPILRVHCPTEEAVDKAAQIRVYAKGVRETGLDVAALAAAFRQAEHADTAEEDWYDL